MDRLAHDVVHAGGKQIERLVQRFGVVHGDHRRLRAPADQFRKHLAAGTVAKQKGFDRARVRFGHALNPGVEIRRRKAGCGHALTLEPGRIAFFHGIALVDDDDHCMTPESNDRTRALAPKCSAPTTPSPCLGRRDTTPSIGTPSPPGNPAICRCNDERPPPLTKNRRRPGRPARLCSLRHKELDHLDRGGSWRGTLRRAASLRPYLW